MRALTINVCIILIGAVSGIGTPDERNHAINANLQSNSINKYSINN